MYWQTKSNVVFITLFIILVNCGDKTKTSHEITQEEITAAVPELSDLHSAVYPLWHDAFPDKDYDLIKKLIPELDSLTTRVEIAELPGILQDKQDAWEAAKEKLLTSLKKLHEAVDTNNQKEMLAQTEAFHANFEGMVRTIRPIVKELDSFHQEMYKLYHYYMPDYDLVKIRETAVAMQEKLPPLKAAKLNRRLEERKEQFDKAVAELETAVNKFAEIAQKDDKEAVIAAVEEVHTCYQGCEEIFDR